MAVQTVVNLSENILSTLERFRAEKAQIVRDGDLSNAGKTSRFDVLYLARRGEVTNYIVRLWGDVIEMDGGATLDPNGAAWVELARLDKAWAEAANKADRAGVDPAYFAIAQTRAQAIFYRSANADEFMRSYKDASRDLRIAIQESGAALIGERGQQDGAWFSAIKQIERDREARLMTDEKRGVRTEIDRLIETLVTAYDYTKQAVNELGSLMPVLTASAAPTFMQTVSPTASGQISDIYKLILVNRQYITPADPMALPYFEVSIHRLYNKMGSVMRLEDMPTHGIAYSEGTR